MSRPSSDSNNSAIALRVNAYTRISQVIAPSSEVGPEPVRVPVTGYSVIAEVACIGKDDRTVLGFRAEVLRRTPFEPSGVMLHVSPDLEPPHLEILLDENPPVIHAALKADGQPARPSPRFPVTLHPGEQAKYFLAPVTQSPDLTRIARKAAVP